MVSKYPNPFSTPPEDMPPYQPRSHWVVWKEKLDFFVTFSKAFAIIGGAVVSMVLFYQQLNLVIVKVDAMEKRDALREEARQKEREADNDFKDLVCKRLKLKCITYKKIREY